MYLNKAFLIGNLTRDPELRSLPSGGKVASISIATNRVWKDKNGVKQESADYHNVVVFGAQAEIVEKYLKKGSSLMVEGRIQTRSWDAADGSKKYRTEIVADRVQFGPRREGSSAGAGSRGPSEPENAGSPSKPIDTIEYPEEDINPDDIPF
ncbi:MAG TPA: single-stranded DNA-binding protein [Candidatus Paceibacterota bacterium]|nr:single-stranded DNA-binding protein [Candidatus Paceibacterota bacterium]